MRDFQYLYIMIFLILGIISCSGKSGAGGSGGNNNKVVEGEKGCIVDSDNVLMGCWERYLNVDTILENNELKIDTSVDQYELDVVYITSPKGYSYAINIVFNKFDPMEEKTYGWGDSFDKMKLYESSLAPDFLNGERLNPPEKYFAVMSYENVIDQVFCKEADTPLINEHNNINYAYDNAQYFDSALSFTFTLREEVTEIRMFDQYELVPCTFNDVGLPNDIQFPLYLIVDDQGSAVEISTTSHPEPKD